MNEYKFLVGTDFEYKLVNFDVLNATKSTLLVVDGGKFYSYLNKISENIDFKLKISDGPDAVAYNIETIEDIIKYSGDDSLDYAAQEGLDFGVKLLTIS